ALVPSGDPEALAEAILATLARRSTFDPAALRASVAGRFDRPAVAAQLVDLYEQVLREQRASPSTSPVARSAGPTPRGDLGRQPTAGPVVIVAFDRPALDATLPRWPAWVLRDALIVTRGPQLPQGRVLAADLEVPVSTLLAWADRPRADSLAAKAVLPLRLRARRRQRARLERLVLPALEAAVEAAVDEVRARSDGPVLVVCLGGIDVLATGRAVRTGRARIAPGGLRWLGDLRWPGTSSQERAAETSPAEAEDQLAASSA
ncbi:MAG: glycosyltransferase, partial [Candidatus Limnocylindrales bacterium]